MLSLEEKVNDRGQRLNRNGGRVPRSLTKIPVCRGREVLQLRLLFLFVFCLSRLARKKGYKKTFLGWVMNYEHPF